MSVNNQMFRALRHRNFRLYFFGQGISLVGTWMQQIGEVWLAYRLTNSAFYLGVVGFASQIPIFLLAPVAGVWADRVNRHRLLILTQTLEMIQAFALAALTLTHHITLSGLIILSVLGGIIDAFDIPTRQSFVIHMVEQRADLANAIALNSSLVNAARLAGPSIAGLLIAAVGEGWCFMINGVSFFAVLFSLLVMRVHLASDPRQPLSVRTQLWQGWTYILRFQPIAILLTMLAALSLITSGNSVLIPIFATRVLRGGPHTLGFLMAGSGLGALVAALALAARRTVLGLGRWIGVSAGLLAGALFAFSWSSVFWVSWLAIGVAGFAMMSSTASINTVLQTIVDEDKRGRVMSFFATAFIGMAPIGNLVSGWVADHFGAPATVRALSLICAISTAIFFIMLPRLRRFVRPVYIKLGILPEVATGLRAASSLQQS
jgi:MFS family permease